MKAVDYIIAGGRHVPCVVPVFQPPQHGMLFPGIKPRAKTDLVTLHWTASESPADRLFANLRKAGKSVHFFVDGDGAAWQFGDADGFMAHAKGMNDRAVGIEIANRANDKADGPPRRALAREKINGKEFVYTLFLPAQIRAALALCAALCEAYALPWQVPMELKPITIDQSVPRHVALPDGISAEAGSGQRLRRVIPRKLTAQEFAAHRGMIGHFHWNDVGKRDPAIALLQAVAAFEPRAAQGLAGPAE